ncbi:hypothetical protein, partial [Chroococcidiopsis cubana]|uniref:hypothetical protein n=1 Tax=Chroococcidiopsis cubana TaxID=171392 RepID=UPI001A7EF026
KLVETSQQSQSHFYPILTIIYNCSTKPVGVKDAIVPLEKLMARVKTTVETTFISPTVEAILSNQFNFSNT